MVINSSELILAENTINDNKIIYKNEKCDCKINLLGTGSVVEIGEKVSFPKDYTLNIPNNCTLKIGDNVSIAGVGVITLYDNSKLIICKNARTKKTQGILLFRSKYWGRFYFCGRSCHRYTFLWQMFHR